MKGITPRQITKGFLVEVDDPKSRLTFQYNPNRITDSRNPDWSNVSIPGMSNPRHQFVTGGSRIVRFTLEFFMPDRDQEGVTKRLRWLHSLTYPKSSARSISHSSPPIILFGFGNYYRNFRCKVNAVEAVGFDLFDPVTLDPKRAEVIIELEEVIYGNGRFKNEIRNGW